MIIAIWVLSSICVTGLAAFVVWGLASSVPLDFPEAGEDVTDVLRSDLEARKAAAEPGRVVCPKCEREVPVRDNGLIRRHRAFATARAAICAGSGTEAT